MNENTQTFFTVTPQVGTTREDMLDPDFWELVAKRLSRGVEIRATPKDGKWYGHYVVLYADDVQAKLVELLFWDLDSTGAVIYTP